MKPLGLNGLACKEQGLVVEQNLVILNRERRFFKGVYANLTRRQFHIQFVADLERGSVQQLGLIAFLTDQDHALGRNAPNFGFSQIG